MKIAVVITASVIGIVSALAIGAAIRDVVGDIGVSPNPPDPVIAGLEHNEGLLRSLAADVADLKAIIERGIVTIPSEPHVRISPNVEGMLTPQISRVLGLALAWSVREGKSIDINSFNDGKHIDGSLHYLDLAIDLDVAGEDRDDLMALGDFLITHLPSGYQVMVNREHIHVEWDETAHN